MHLAISLEMHTNMHFPHFEVVLERLVLLSIAQHAHNVLVMQLVVVATCREDRAANLFRLNKAETISKKSVPRKRKSDTIIQQRLPTLLVFMV